MCLQPAYPRLHDYRSQDAEASHVLTETTVRPSHHFRSEWFAGLFADSVASTIDTVVGPCRGRMGCSCVYSLLVFAWSIILPANAKETKGRAADDDPGHYVVFVIAVVTSLVGLFAVVVGLHAVKDFHPSTRRSGGFSRSPRSHSRGR